MIRIEAGDALQVIPELVSQGVVVDSIVTDPPYHLTARTKRFGKEGSAPPQYGKDGAMGRLSKGFMGQEWDGGDIAFRPETWATVGTIMRPGAFMLVFGGTRTYHRMTCAIEDAGFVIQDCIMWMYGTGFPKRRDMLKPAYEPIVVAYKPGGDRTMQIDECRIGTDQITIGRRGHSGDNGIFGDDARKYERDSIGRWPANICHDGSDEVVSAFPQTGVSAGGRKVNISTTSKIYGGGKGLGQNISADDARGDPGYGDSGSAARFFWSPKANKKDRNGSKHPTVKPISLLDWLVPLVTPIGGTVLDPFAGTGTTGSAAVNTGRKAILIEREPEYLQDIRGRFNEYSAITAAEQRRYLTSLIDRAFSLREEAGSGSP